VKVCIIGASGAVGREMVADLADSGLDVEVSLFASARSEGTTMEFRGRNLRVRAYSLEVASECQYALMSAGGDFSRVNSPQLAQKGVTVIDNSSAWRMDPDVPLVVPEVNRALLSSKMLPKGIIANPNCTTIQLVVALVALRDKFGLEQVVVSSYQSVSGTGQKGIGELAAQVQGHLRFQEPEPQVYRQPIAFNLLPAIDRLDTAGHCFEEEKIVRETRRILDMPGLPVLATTVRTPTFHCHGESVTVRLGREVTLAEAKSIFASADGITFVDADDISAMPTPRKVAGDRSVWVSRVRLPLDSQCSDWLQFWVIADNLKKGAATNAVQILEALAVGGTKS
jgi:aspartate-semialdehyde dehydrogenase